MGLKFNWVYWNLQIWNKYIEILGIVLQVRVKADVRLFYKTRKYQN